MSEKIRILFIIPSLLSARNLVMSGVLKRLVTHANVTVLLLDTVPEEIQKALDALNCELLTENDIENIQISVLEKIKYKAMRNMHRCLGPSFSYGGSVYRFNEINGFVGHIQKKRMSKNRREKETRAGNFVSPRYAFPFPKSILIFRCVQYLLWSRNLVSPKISKLFDAYRPNTVFIAQVQTPKMRDYIVEANSRDIKSIGYIASWDQPSTKGAIPNLFAEILVQSDWMKEQLEKYHNIPSTKLKVVGWPQMDVYFEHQTRSNKQLNLIRNKYGINKNAKVIMFALNAERLGKDEPALIQKLLDKTNKSDENYVFLLRPHPKDASALKRYKRFETKQNVLFLNQDLGCLTTLLEQIILADVILNSTGSFSLDATALDKPFIYIGFEGDDCTNGLENIASWYKLDHLKSVVETKAIGPASNIDDLLEKIEEAIKNPKVKIEQRATLRKKHLEPFDGKAAQRIAEIVGG